MGARPGGQALTRPSPLLKGRGSNFGRSRCGASSGPLSKQVTPLRESLQFPGWETNTESLERETGIMRHIAFLVAFGLFAFAGSASAPAEDGRVFGTDYARIKIDGRGFITSIMAGSSGKEFSPAGHPSPLLCLHESGQANDKLVLPAAASFSESGKEITLKYANGATALVTAGAKGAYLRFQLVSLEPRGTVDNVVWGPVNTTIRGKIGDMIGVVRDRDFAIGMMGLEDNTISGPVEDGDCYGMGYYVHSSDPQKYPLDPKYKEGEWFNIGGDGISDVAFYSHPEEYFNQVMGSGAKLAPEFGSYVVYHSRDRRKAYVHYYSLLPGFKIHERKHMVSDPVPGVDFIGSAIALYACPDDLGLKTIEKIIRGEGLPYVTDRDGRWVRDPAAVRPQLFWNGPVDKAIEYAQAMGFKDISRDTGEFYPSLPKKWVGHVDLKGKSITYKEFADECHTNGLTHGGLHTLCLFLQGGVSSDVTPVPSEHLQTVCRTKLAHDISATDTEIVVTDPSFLAENTTWPKNGGSENYIRVGPEMMMYSGISDTAPWTLKNVKRGHASKAVPHKAGAELVKLMQNCYNGFVPDMKLMLDYADYYANLMARNGMDSIGFDGFESTIYQNHGYYAVRVFCRRLFEDYYKLTGGKYPYVGGSCVFPGAWEYWNSCNVGGGNNMFDSVSGKWGIEGKDIRNAWDASWYPPTFGIQGWNSNWSLYDAETLMSMAVAWDGTFALSTSQDAIDKTAAREAIFKSFSAWQEAREKQLFTQAQKEKLRDSSVKFHLEKTADGSFVLHTVTRGKDASGKDTWVVGPGEKVGRPPVTGPEIIESHRIGFTAPAKHVPSQTMVDGPLLGNGDIGVVVAGNPEALRFYIGKNDFWGIKTQAPMAVGQVRIHTPALAGALYQAECDMRRAHWQGMFTNGAVALTTRAWVDANSNRFFVELVNDGTTPLEIAVTTVKGAGSSSAPPTSVPPAPGPATVKQIGGEPDAGLSFSYEPDAGKPNARTLGMAVRILQSNGRTVTLAPHARAVVAAAIFTDLDAKGPLHDAQQALAGLTPEIVSEYAAAHRSWWEEFWRKSFVEIPDKVIEQHWYSTQYIMASCSRPGKVAPGLWGNWITRDDTSWHGDFHLNYNFQAPYYSVYSANHPETSLPFYDAMSQMIPRGQRIAAARGWKGIHLPVSMGPWGMCPEGDNSDWGQRSNAAYAALNFIWYYQYTQDTVWLKATGYPYLREVETFWTDYLKLENGRYVIHNDSIHEGSGPDFNPILSLGLVRTLYKNILVMSEDLGVNAGLRPKWKDILVKISAFPTQQRNGKTVFLYTEKGMDWCDNNTLGIQHVFPAGAIGLDSGPELLEVSRNMLDAMGRWADSNGSSSWYTACARVGYEPEKILSELRKMYDQHSMPNKLLYFGGGGIENASPSLAVNEMLLQSHEGLIRFFPAWPRHLDARFGTLRAVGAFLVSAELKDGEVTNLRILSEKGKNLTVQNPWAARPVRVQRNGQLAELATGDRFMVKTAVNETIVLKPE